MNQLGLYSKNSEYNGYSGYYTKCKDVYVWQNGQKYLDCGIMGIGTSLLAYNNKQVNKAVKKSIDKGVFSSSNCYEEKLLAQKMQEIHDFECVTRFARTGGEAMMIALQIALNNTDKKEAIQTGYSGWILENLKLKKFEYNNIENLKKVLNKNVGVIVLDIVRNEYPTKEFMQYIYDICKKQKIILVVDEITAGFKFNYGGFYKNIYVEDNIDNGCVSAKQNEKFPIQLKPDIIVYGKAISNGFAFSMIVGKKHIMENANKSFISSTYWTERIGTAACLKTLELLEKQNFDYLYKVGLVVQKIWYKMSKKYKVPIEINQIPQLAHFKFLPDKRYGNQENVHNKYLTIFVNVLLSQNILGGCVFYSCFKHRAKHLLEYEKACDNAFMIISNNRDTADILIEKNNWKLIKNLPVKIR